VLSSLHPEREDEEAEAMLRIVCVSLLLVSLAGADVVYRASEPVEPAIWLGSDGEGTLVEFNLQALTMEEGFVEGYGSGSVFRILQGGISSAIGAPDVPVLRRMVLVPNTGGIALEIVSEETSSLGMYSISPRQPLPSRSGGALPYRIDEELYATSEFFPAGPAELGSIEILRDLRVAWVEFNPVRINPVTGEVLLTTSVTVRLVNEGPGENELVRASTGISRSYLPFYREVVGFEEGGQDLVDGCYLVIGTSESIGLCQDLIDWKIEKGFDIQYGEVPGIGSNSSAIDAWIENAYNTWSNPPEWLLIIGDHNIVPTPQSGGAAADNQYGVIGSGVTPSIHVGRLSGADTDDLPYMASKILNYESDPYEPAPSWFQNAISIGSTDFQDPAHSLEYAQIFMAAGMTVDYFCSQGGMPPTTSNVFNSIEAGKSLISFIGHGYMQGWGDPPCGSISDVQAMSNGRLLPWINSIACNNAEFDSGYCFGEAWMGEGTIGSPKGAIGFMGATTGSPVGPTDSLAEYTFRGYFEEDIWHMGAAVDYGKMKVEEFYGSGAASNNNMHMVFGCPEMDIFCETSPLPFITVSHASTIAPGVFDVTVGDSKAPVVGALVGVAQNAVLLDGAYTNSSGVASLNIPSIPTGDDVNLTVTYHNMYPYTAMVPVSGTGVGGSAGTVAVLALGRVLPNPVTVAAQISYVLPAAGEARLQVFDLSGRIISTITDGEQAAGMHTVTWNGDDHNGQLVPDGVYFYRLTTPDGSLVRSCVVMR
jgi:gingipain R